MNRAERRRLAKIVKGRQTGETVELHGGPMNTWHVRPDAAALDPGWGAIAGHPGFAYVRRSQDSSHADWRPITPDPA